jgi:hypothetical protein
MSYPDIGDPPNSGDAVALAVDRPSVRIGNTTVAAGYLGERNPFGNVTFVKNCIASGSIVPPHGESAAVRRTDYLVGLCVICLVACGLVGFCVAYFWKG